MKAKVEKRSGPLTALKLTLMFAILSLVAGDAGAFAENYGAIAYSASTGAYGYSYDLGSRAEAEKTALAECSARGSGCRVYVWFMNQCGALAVGDNVYGYGLSRSSSRAEARALSECRKRGKNCRTVCRACSTR